MNVVRERGLAVTFTDLNFGTVASKFDAEGRLADESMNPRIDAFFAELLWMSRTLALGRENVPSKHHPQPDAPVAGS